MRIRNRIFSGIVTLVISAAALLYLGSASPLCAQSANSGQWPASSQTRVAQL